MQILSKGIIELDMRFDTFSCAGFEIDAEGDTAEQVKRELMEMAIRFLEIEIVKLSEIK